MTREEALRRVKGYLTDVIPKEDYSEVEEIMKALEQEPYEIIKEIPKDYKYDTETEDFLVYRHMYTGHEIHIEKPVPKYRLEQQSCDDAINRQYLLDNCVVDKITMPYVPVSKIENAPPVLPQPIELKSILNKIRSEIESIVQEETVTDNSGGEYERTISKLDPDDVFEIIDKYRK